MINGEQWMVLVAECAAPDTGATEIVAVARLSRTDVVKEAEFAIVISDIYQGHGLGTKLISELLDGARSLGLARVSADILGENRQMLEICRQLGFHLTYAGDGVVKAILTL